jgi:hypothetical protein
VGNRRIIERLARPGAQDLGAEIRFACAGRLLRLQSYSHEGHAGGLKRSRFEPNLIPIDRSIYFNIKNLFKPDEEYADITVTFSLQPNGDIIKNLPRVRVLFQK